MLLPINAKSKTALYIQIYHILKEKIHQKELQTNEKLPSKRKLAKTNNISENTVTTAYEQLLIEGYIYSIERKGYYVSNIEFHIAPNYPEISQKKKKTMSSQRIKSYAYDFTRSIPDLELFPFDVFSKLYRQLLQKTDNLLINETDGQGLYPLRKQLQRYLSTSRGVPCSPEQIILAPSTESLLEIVFQLIGEDLVIGLEDPGYQGFRQLLNRSVIPYTPVQMTNNGLDMNELTSSDINTLIVTSNHQFPTGKIMPLKERQSLLDWANMSTNRYIIENDYDSEFKYSGIPIPSLKYLDQTNRVIHIGNFTRILSPGIRLSYMVLPDNLIQKYQDMYSNSSSSLSTFEQWVLCDFIKEGHFSTHLNRSRTFYKKKRDQMIQAIEANDPNATIFGAEAGLHLLVRPSIRFNETLFKKKTLEYRIKLNVLSDYSFAKKRERESLIFLSFSSIPENEIDEIVKLIFDIIQLTVIK